MVSVVDDIVNDFEIDEFRRKKIVGAIAEMTYPKSMTVHSQCLHQQAEVAALVIEEFMRIVGSHIAKLYKEIVLFSRINRECVFQFYIHVRGC